GLEVATAAFPRYGDSIHADLGAEALHGEHGDLVDSVHAMALLWALDRRAAAGRIAALLADHDLVLLDRYVASNAAYGAARRGEQAPGAFTEWVHGLEFDRFSLSRPDRQLLLDVPVEVAADRARRRAAADAARTRDAYERDDGLQQAVAARYRALAAAGWAGAWTVLAPEWVVSADARDQLAAVLGATTRRCSGQ